MGQLKAYYERLVRLGASDWEMIAARFHRNEFRTGAILSAAGVTETYLSFIECGLVRYFIPDDADGQTFDFALSRDFCCAYDSFLTREPSEYSLQALRPTTVWQITHDDLQAVYTGTAVGNQLGRIASERLYLAKSARELLFRRLSASGRYRHVLETRPELFRDIPLKYIASYIGITPQALSRIRRGIL